MHFHVHLRVYYGLHNQHGQKIYIFPIESLPFISGGGISVLSFMVVVCGTVDVSLGAKEVEVCVPSVD